MKLITDFELTGRTDAELAVLFHMASQALAVTIPGSPGRRTVIASLQNISRARTVRHRQCTVPGF
jgi:hypothetical protein